MNIYVGNLDFRVDEKDLGDMFSEYGSVSSAKVIMDKFNGRSKGFGFVEMENDSEAMTAIENLNGTEVDGRTRNVNEARQREPRGGSRW